MTLKISLQISLHRQRSPQTGRRRKFIWLYGNKRSQPLCAMCSFKMIASDPLLNLKHGSRPFTQGAVSDITPTKPPDRRQAKQRRNPQSSGPSKRRGEILRAAPPPKRHLLRQRARRPVRGRTQAQEGESHQPSLSMKATHVLIKNCFNEPERSSNCYIDLWIQSYFVQNAKGAHNHLCACLICGTWWRCT